MGLIKKLIPIALLSLCMGCQTQKATDISKQINNVPSQQQSNIIKPNPPVYMIDEYMGYSYPNGRFQLIIFPRPILDTYIEGDYKVIKAR